MFTSGQGFQVMHTTWKWSTVETIRIHANPSFNYYNSISPLDGHTINLLHKTKENRKHNRIETTNSTTHKQHKQRSGKKTTKEMLKIAFQGISWRNYGKIRHESIPISISNGLENDELGCSKIKWNWGMILKNDQWRKWANRTENS